jgi:hypothetical protein
MKRLLIIFSLTSLILWLLKEFTSVVTPKIWVIQAFFFCTFLIGHRLYLIAKQKPISQFHIFHFTMMTLRLLGAIIFLFVMVIYTDVQKFTFIVDFLFMYLLYTGFEIYFLIDNLRTDFKNGDANK